MANTAVTISRAKVSPLSETEWSLGENTVKFHVDYTDVNFGTTSTDTVTMTLGSTPGKWYAQNAKVNVTTAFAGTTAFSLIVGTTSSTNAFITSASLTAVSIIGSPLGNQLTNANGQSAVSLVATFTNATGGSPSALTAGAADIFLGLVDTTQALN